MSVQVGPASELGVSARQVQEFYRQNWNRRIALEDDLFYRWQFTEVPGADDKDHCSVAVNERGDVVGVMGLNPRPFLLKGAQRNAAELTTWIVHPDYQSRGVGPQIMADLQRRFDVLLGLGITKSALAVYLRSGFRYLRAIPRFVYVLDWAVIAPYAKIDPLARKVDTKRRGALDCVTYSAAAYTPDIGEDVALRFGSKSNHFCRTDAFVQWRFFRHPYFAYEVFAIRPHEGSSDTAIIVLREDTSDEGLRILHVVDLYGDAGALSAALKFAQDEAKRRQAAALDCYGTFAELQARILAAGWFSTLDEDFLSFPHLFHPTELRTPASTSMVIWARNADVEIFDFSRLHVSKADADLDRPTMAVLHRGATGEEK